MVIVRILLCAMCAMCSAFALPVIVNGSPSDASGNEMTAYVQTEDFQLAEASVLTGARFWAFYFDDLGSGYLNSITWQIYGNNGNEPGSLLQFGEVTPVLTTGVENCCAGVALQLDFTLPNVTLAAGTYWLGLHNGPLSETATEYFYWQTSASSIGGSGREQSVSLGGSWVNTNLEHAFELEGTPGGSANSEVPEPSTWTTAILGIAGVWLGRRRKNL